jgi:L,D-transpeptidase YcbB
MMLQRSCYLSYSLVTIAIFICSTSCDQSHPSKDQKIVASLSNLDAAVAVQMQEVIFPTADSSSQHPLANLQSLKQYYNSRAYEAIWSSKGIFVPQATSLKQFIDKGCKYYGLFPASYHQLKLSSLMRDLQADSMRKNSEKWAECDALLTDAFFQIVKHVSSGRLYTDSNYRYFDSSMYTAVLQPQLQQYLAGASIQQGLLAIEPNFLEYRNLKDAIKNLLENNVKQYASIVFPNKDSLKLVANIVQRMQQEGIGMNLTTAPDSVALQRAIKEWQHAHGLSADGKLTKEFIDEVNQLGKGSFEQAALSMDKLRANKIKHSGDYVLVNIPSYYLRAYRNDSVCMESKVAVGKIASKTPVMESEISEVIIMPHWYVPPSILKIPGWLDRHRNNPNFVVSGKSAMQKSGPGNALGNMKFNFKSGDAIYLHDTNEKWAFGSSKRAVSHGCVRVQNYSRLADFIATVSPIYEKRFEKKVDKVLVDSTGDSTIKYKYVIKDSTKFAGDSLFTNLLKKKSHRELSVTKKVPIYINYLTCVGRNGSFVIYPDVYGYDATLIRKYFAGLKS